MEPHHINQRLGDSQLSRSRASSQVSVGESRLEGLNITEAPINVTTPTGTASSESGPSFTPNHISESRASPAFLDCPVPQALPSYPFSSQSAFVQDWSFLETSEAFEAPALRLEQPHDHVGHLNPTDRLNSLSRAFDQADMSTLGIQFDARFDAGSRPSYSWPVFDMNESYGNQGLEPLDPFHEPGTVPIYARSLSSSPPQAMFTPEQRELKRQRDQARRDSKTKIRRERSASNSYTVSQATTPDLLPRAIDDYSSVMVPTSNVATASLPLVSHAYLTPNQMSSSASPELYGTAFPMISNDFGGGFLIPYSSAPADAIISSYPARPHSMSSASDHPYFYRSQPTPAPQESADTVRVVHSRPKPQCWDHGCNGRQFSTFSNLLRHQREKSGVASKPTCPKCGAEFTRTTARNGHMAHEKCKQRRNS